MALAGSSSVWMDNQSSVERLTTEGGSAIELTEISVTQEIRETLDLGHGCFRQLRIVWHSDVGNCGRNELVTRSLRRALMVVYHVFYTDCSVVEAVKTSLVIDVPNHVVVGDYLQ